MTINSKQKELIKFFIFLFVLSFILVNWDEVSWLFNYKEMSGLVYDFFNPYQDSNLVIVTQENLPAPGQNTNTIIDTSTHILSYQTVNTLQIPAIGVSTPVITAKNTNAVSLAEELDKGAVYYPGSVAPGQEGQMIILGHSAPPNWPHIKHDYIFSDINSLNFGDQITLTFNQKQYVYKVKDKQIIQQGQDAKTSQLAGKNILTLISCWPPGKNYKRIAVSAELVN